MRLDDPPPPLRTRFADSPAGPQSRVLRLLLAQDGSTTRLCEAVAGGPVQLHMVRQQVTSDVPDCVRRALGGVRYLARVTFLAARGAVMMDNLSYTVLDGVAPELEAGLHAGRLPIGHLLAGAWVRRSALDSTADVAELAQHLSQAVGAPDAAATRAYAIATPTGACMVIAEIFRAGMLMEPVDRPLGSRSAIR